MVVVVCGVGDGNKDSLSPEERNQLRRSTFKAKGFYSLEATKVISYKDICVGVNGGR